MGRKRCPDPDVQHSSRREAAEGPFAEANPRSISEGGVPMRKPVERIGVDLFQKRPKGTHRTERPEEGGIATRTTGSAQEGAGTTERPVHDAYARAPGPVNSSSARKCGVNPVLPSCCHGKVSGPVRERVGPEDHRSSERWSPGSRATTSILHQGARVDLVERGADTR